MQTNSQIVQICFAPIPFWTRERQLGAAAERQGWNSGGASHSNGGAAKCKKRAEEVYF